jgi:hypothetical protein
VDERITEEVMLLFVLLFVRLGDVLEAGIARLWFVRGGRVACAKYYFLYCGGWYSFFA